MKNLLCLLIFFALTGAACKKDTSKDTLPAITQEGKNTFGCYVDGQLWLPAGEFSLTAQNLCIQSSTDGGLALSIRHDHSGSDLKDYFNILFNPLTMTGSYDLADQSKAQTKLAVAGESEFGDTYTVSKGSITITRFDQVIAGQFSFSIKNNRTNKIYNVTEGRFDLKSDYCF